MIITCEACSRRYLINPESLGTKGRTVKCASCGFSWRQDPPEDMPKTLSDFPEESLQKERTENLQKFEDSAGLVVTEEALYENPLARPSLYQKSRGVSPQKYRWFISGFVVLGIIAALYFGRYYIVHKWSYAGKLYEVLGIETNPFAYHLDLQNVSWMPGVDENGNPIFILKGYIINRSEKVKMIPPLTIAILSSPQNNPACKTSGCVIDRWIVHTVDDRILPGETYPFQIMLKKTIPTGATNLHIEFVKP